MSKHKRDQMDYWSSGRSSMTSISFQMNALLQNYVAERLVLRTKRKERRFISRTSTRYQNQMATLDQYHPDTHQLTPTTSTTNPDTDGTPMDYVCLAPRLQTFHTKDRSGAHTNTQGGIERAETTKRDMTVSIDKDRSVP